MPAATRPRAPQCLLISLPHMHRKSICSHFGELAPNFYNQNRNCLNNIALNIQAGLEELHLLHSYDHI